MGNQKSLYKTYINELYLHRSDKSSTRPRPTTVQGELGQKSVKTHSSSGSSRQTPDGTVNNSHSQTLAHGQVKLQINAGRQTADVTSSINSSNRHSLGISPKIVKTFKIIIDAHHSFTISVPEKLIPHDEDSVTGIHSGNQDCLPTCGWLMEQVQIKQAQLIKQLKRQSGSNRTQLKKKLIVALKTVDGNETIDFWLTQYNRPLKPLPSNLTLEPHNSKILINKTKAVLTNDFKMMKVIGKGGFSKVFMVRKKDTGFIYAMKVMKKDQVTNESKLRQIMNERTIMQELADHPFIVKLHYAFQSQKVKFPEFLAKFYFAEILLGLEFLHSKNIVYRDLKPENVLIDVDGHIKLADFGLSKIFKNEERSFSFCGSPEYMCPEILKREGHNHMVDYYTLGALLFEMLTGLPPFYTNNRGEMTKRILESELTYPAHLSPIVVNLISKLLERNQNNRLGSLRGIEEIKQHEWCEDIDWDMVLQKKLTPLWKPRLDQSNFDPELTQLPLNFDESKFKRALQGDRQFSFYYESPIQSLTVTEHSIYASNPDLNNLTNNDDIKLQSGSSKQLLEHFFLQKNSYERQPTIMLTAKDFEEIYQSQKRIMQMNMQTATKINESLVRDESKINLEYNEEDGHTNFRGFSFFGESQDEKDVKSQLIKYNKLRNKLNSKLKKILDEEGQIKGEHLRDLSLSSCNSSVSLGTITVLPTPPVYEDQSSSRHSNPSAYNRMQTHGTVSNNEKVGGNEQSFMTSGSPSPMFQQIKHYGVIDKKQKQQLILRKLGSGERQLYKSFQPEIVESHSGSKQNKKQDLFRSNIETQSQNLLNAYTQNFQISQKDFMNESIQSSFIDEESVAEERQSFATVHKTQPNPHQNINSGLDFQSVNNDQQEESKEEIASINNEVSVDGYYHVNEESKDESPYDKSQYDDALRQNSGTLKNVKFILFKSQNVKKHFIDKKLQQTSKTPKLVMTQRSRMGNNKEEYFPQSNQYSSLSNSGNNSRLQQSNTVGGTVIAQHNTNSSSSQAMTNSREQQSNELKSVLTTDYGSTKHTFDHQSQRSGQQLQTQLSVKPVQNYEDEAHSDKQQALNQSEDLDKTQNIIATQQMESSTQKQKQISPSKKQEAQKILRQSQQQSKKQSIQLHKKQMLTLDLDIGSPIPKKLKSPSKDQGLSSDKEEELKLTQKSLKKTIFDPDDGDFDIHYVKRIPMTARGGEFSTQHFTFELNATDEEENEEDDHDEQRTPKIIEARNITQSKSIASSSLVSRLKKPLHRSKQVSADFDNEFYAQIRNSIELERQKIAQQKKLAAIKVQALSITTKNTPTNTSKKSITFSQKVAVTKKGSSNRLSEDQNSEIDNGESQNFRQAKTGKQPPAAKPSNLKKGTVTTQSTANFTRLNNLEAQTSNVSSLLPPSTSRLGKTTTMKPPLNQIKLGDPKLKSIKNLASFGAVSPSGALKSQAQASVAFSSQPSSAKNTNSNKIAFPISVQSNSMETQSPAKKITNQKIGSSFAKSLKSLKQKTSSIQENLGGTLGEDSDSSKIPTQTISLVQDIYEPSKFKPPSSTKNSQIKAFFA